MGEYNGKGDPGEHVQLINDQLNYFHTDKSFECKLFMLTLIGSTKLWFNALSDESIHF